MSSALSAGLNGRIVTLGSLNHSPFGRGSQRDQELARFKRELARMTKAHEFLETRQRTLPGSHQAVHSDQALPQRIPVQLMCRCLKASASGYYDRQAREPSLRAQENARGAAR